MRLLIGIPSYRRAEGLRRLLASIACQRGIDELQIEVFVADNDSAGREATSVCASLSSGFRWPLTSRVVEERGISAARNAILDHARARGVDFVAMIDDDEEAEPEWLFQLLEMQRSTGADLVGGPVDYVLEPGQSRVVTKCDEFRAIRRPAGRVPMIDATNNVLMSCDALSNLGWPKFDQAFGITGGGDKEYFTRLRSRGAGFAWAPAARVREHVPTARSNAGWLVRRAYRVGNSDMRITRQHGGAAGVVASLGKAIVLLGSAPLALPILLLPSRRLWIVRKWSRSAGKLAALAGREYREYDRQRTASDP